jgi:hypothetical protein
MTRRMILAIADFALNRELPEKEVLVKHSLNI